MGGARSAAPPVPCPATRRVGRNTVQCDRPQYKLTTPHTSHSWRRPLANNEDDGGEMRVLWAAPVDVRRPIGEA